MNRRTFIIIFATLLALSPVIAFAKGPVAAGAVYAMTNAPDGNAVVAFERNRHGALTQEGVYPTGGLGTGGGIDPLVSQGSLILSANQRWLFAVNAGSDSVSVFRVWRNGLRLEGTYDSGGSFPVSLASYHNLLYVLNAGSDAEASNITGFRLNRKGALTPIDGAARSLGAGGYHQVGFSPTGDRLVITDGSGSGANQILIFSVDEEGVPGESPTITPSPGIVPFGFVFDWNDHLFVAEAGSGAVSSYRVNGDNTLDVIDASVPNGNAATCWIVANRFGTIFTANTASDNISSYKRNPFNGEIRLQDAEAGFGNRPIDMAVTASGRFLYVLNAGDGTIGAFQLSPHGAIRDLGVVAGLPLTFAQGIAAR